MSNHEIYDAYQHLIRPIAARLARQLPGHSLEDLRQTGSVGLLEACAKFRPARAATFAQFARARIRGAMLDSLPRSKPLASTDAPEGSYDGESPERGAEIAEMQTMVEELPERQREILRLRYGGEMSLRAAGRAAGISTAAAVRREKRALQTLRKWMAA